MADEKKEEQPDPDPILEEFPEIRKAEQKQEKERQQQNQNQNQDQNS